MGIENCGGYCTIRMGINVVSLKNQCKIIFDEWTIPLLFSKYPSAAET